jgi:hypothetical protein
LQRNFIESVDRKPDKMVEKAVPQLARITSMIGVKYNNHELFYMPYECRSLTEDKIVKFATKDFPNRRTQLIHNMTTFSRIYPNGSRINSSNYSPLMSWGSGA